MTARVALLRGINVGRGNRIAMADLRSCLEKEGFGPVRTLLASGNVIFDAAASDVDEVLASRLHDAVLQRFDVDARVLVLDEDAVRAIVDENPWRDLDLDPSRVLIMIPMDGASTRAALELQERQWPDEEIFVGKRAVHLHCPRGISQGELADEAGRCMGKTVTARNWRTMLRIVDSMDSIT